MDLLVIIYVALAFFAVIIYLFNLFELKGKRKQIGTIRAQWSSRFNLTIRMNWIIWAAVVAYLAWSLFLIISEPFSRNEYIFLFIFALFLSFYPRWTVVIASKGIISGMEVFLWEDLKEWQILGRGKSQYLEMKLESRTTPPEIKTKRIGLPSNKDITLPSLHNNPRDS
jgi:hypothetical protein